jgi:hypothetical protein
VCESSVSRHGAGLAAHYSTAARKITLGDGVNDAPAMHAAADTSLSVEDAMEVGRERRPISSSWSEGWT